MQTSISGHHYHISDTTKEHIQQCVDRFEKYFSPIIDCMVTVTQDNNQFRTDIVVNVQGKTLKSSEDGDALFPVIDEAVGKMERQLRKLKDKQHSR